MTDVHITAGVIVRFVFGVLLLIFIIGFGIWAYIQILKKSEDPGSLVVKTIFTVGLGIVWLAVAVPLAFKGGGEAFGGVSLSMVEGLVMYIMWRREIAGLIANPIASLYDGGTTEYEPTPVYSHAQAARKQGDFQGALAVIRSQLEKFPTDIEGQ